MDNLNSEFMCSLLERIEKFDIDDFKVLIIKIGIEKDCSEKQNYLNLIDEVLLEKYKTYENLKSESSLLEKFNDTDLIKDVTEFYDSIRNGDFEGEWQWDPEYHKERMMGDDTWAEYAAELLLRTADAYWQDEYKIALEAYEMLFDILNTDGLAAYDDYETMMGIDLDKQKNLYLICIYFSYDIENRASKIIDAIPKLHYGYRRDFKLKNLIDVHGEELPEFDEFTKSFIKILTAREDVFLKDLLIDTVFIYSGIEGLKKFASENYDKYPESYLFLVKKLTDDNEIIELCEEALLKISRDNVINDSIAKILISIALKVDKPSIVMSAIKEAFYSNPKIENLVLMFEYGRKYNIDENENVLFATTRLKDLIEINSNNQRSATVISAKTVLHKLYLLSNQISKAFEMVLEDVKDEDYLDDILRLTKSFLLILLSKNNNRHFKIIKIFFTENVAHLRIGEDISEKLSNIIYQNIQLISISEDEAKNYTDWCISTTKKEVDLIVSNQYRGQYDYAATSLIACTEMIKNVKGEDIGSEFINGIRIRYPRHINFVKAVNTILKNC